MGIGPGDDVVLPSFICRSVLEAVQGAGANPVFADIDETLNVTVTSVEAALTPKTKCVIVAHLFGTAAPVDEIAARMTPRGIAVMDDAAQALGVRLRGRLVGSFGTCGIVCCGPGKPLAGAAGGVLVTNDKQVYDRAAAVPLGAEGGRDVRRRVRDFWVWRRFRRYTLPFKIMLDRARRLRTEPAHVNAPMSNLDGAVALAQFASIEGHAAARRRNAQLLVDRLASLPGAMITDLAPTAMAVKLIYLLPDGTSVDAVIDSLASHGIEAQGGYGPLHAEHSPEGSLPVTAALWRRVLCVPVETKPPARDSVFGVRDSGRLRSQA